MGGGGKTYWGGGGSKTYWGGGGGGTNGKDPNIIKRIIPMIVKPHLVYSDSLLVPQLSVYRTYTPPDSRAIFYMVTCYKETYVGGGRGGDRLDPPHLPKKFKIIFVPLGRKKRCGFFGFW